MDELRTPSALLSEAIRRSCFCFSGTRHHQDTWNVSIYQKIPRTGYICPHCESRLRAGETLPNIQASQKARPQRTKGATP